MLNGSKRLVAVLAAASCLAATAAACGSSSSSDSSAPASSGSIKGQTITVLVPYKIPQSVIDSFTKATGVKVNYVVTGWDQTHNKLVVANTAQTYVADVAEFDWSFTGQFAGAKWVQPLEGTLPPALMSDLSAIDAAFQSGGKTYAACFSNDFRMSLYNTAMFKKAGITEFPKTFAELGTAAEKLKASGVKYPIAIPMAATEGGVTPWYLLTLAHGGQLFDENFNPEFDKPGSAGYQALQWEVDAIKNGWVSPGAVSQDDTPTSDKFYAGENAIILASSPGSLATANDPSQSKVAGDVAPALVPGVDGPGASFGLPEGLSIPTTAKHPEAAAAFIKWWQKADNSILIYKKEGNLPCGASVLKKLADDGELQGGQVVAEEATKVKALFPQGAPVWYSAFSSDAQGLLNAAVRGDMSVQDALSELATKAKQDAQN